MQNIVIDFIKRYIGQTGLYALVFLLLGGSGYAYVMANVVTPTMLAEQIDTVKASATVDRVELEQSILRKEQNEILDKIDEGKAKPRHRLRLKEVSDRLKTLDSLKTDAIKKLTK